MDRWAAVQVEGPGPERLRRTSELSRAEEQRAVEGAPRRAAHQPCQAGAVAANGGNP